MSIAFKSLSIRLTPLPTRAWLHCWRFAWLLHRRPQDPETALLRDLLQPGDIGVDVGRQRGELDLAPEPGGLT